MFWKWLVFFGLWIGGVIAQGNAQTSRLFSPQIIDGELPGAYQVTLADINGDGRLDIAVLGEGQSGIYWYENPTWKKRPICVGTLNRLIDLAFSDVDEDGKLEVAVASDFDLGKTSEGGTVSWLERKDDLDQPWSLHPIHIEPTAHRLRWVDTDGDGREELIVAPIVGVGTEPPDYHQEPVRLLCFFVPANPQTDPWQYELIDESLHLVHGLTIAARTEKSKGKIFVASAEGVTRFERKDEFGRIFWDKKNLFEGSPASQGQPGCSELTVGTLNGPINFLATIEPWHGNQVAFYLPPLESGKPFFRKVIDDSFVQGHALSCADFDGDGDDEIIAGYRGNGGAIYYYDSSGEYFREWSRTVIDQGETAAQGFVVGDVNGDGKLDFVATGGSTHNVKLFLNQGMKSE